jgi:hypothetical protein
MWILVASPSATVAVEVAGSETVKEFRSLVAGELNIDGDFVLALREICLLPDDTRPLSALPFLRDQAVLSADAGKQARDRAQAAQAAQPTSPSDTAGSAVLALRPARYFSSLIPETVRPLPAARRALHFTPLKPVSDLRAHPKGCTVA